MRREGHDTKYFSPPFRLECLHGNPRWLALAVTRLKTSVLRALLQTRSPWLCSGLDLRRRGSDRGPRIACETGIRFSSLFVDGDVSRETSPSTKSEEKRMPVSQAILGPLSLPRLLRSRPEQSHGLLVWRRARRTEVFRRVTASASQRGLPCRHSRRKGGEKYLVSCPSRRTLPKAEGWKRV